MNSKKNLILTLIVVFNLAGCAVTEEVPAEKDTIELQQASISQLEKNQQEIISQVQELESKLAEWNKIKPNVQRLVAIETQLNTLISQLSTLAQEAQQKNRQVAQRQAAKQRPQKTKDKYYMLQLASLNSLESLKKMWRTKQVQHPNLLTGLEARYQYAKIKGKTYYRLKVGKFTSSKEAKKVCLSLIRQQTNCLLAPFSGEPLQAL